MVALFDELDVDGTYHAVRWFFYERLPEIKRKAGALVQFQLVRLVAMSINYDMHYPSLAKLLGFFSTLI
ncbi:hypothetical protein EFQ43_00340 [Limosilactobacillus fermentum]|nr:hypothetical protein [Limosilactobacillus fermentum]